MTQQELIDQIRRLPIRQKVPILETILHNLGEDVEENGKRASVSREQKLAAVPRLQGC
jgi:hypothetical protein